MPTVIPKQPKRQRDQITIRLDREVLEILAHYCRYMESGRDWIINQCLSFIFRKDKAFMLWLAGQKNGNSLITSGGEQPMAMATDLKGKNGAAQGRLSIHQ